MSRNLLISLIVASMFAGCVQKDIVLETNTTVQSTLKAQENNVTETVKIEDASEDTLFMASVLALQNSDFESAEEYLSELYKKTGQEVYLYQLTQLLMQTGNPQKAIVMLEEKLKQTPQNLELKKSLVTLMLSNKMLKEAKVLARQIATHTGLVQDYDLSATIAIYIEDYQQALSELKIAYSISHDESILDKMATVLFVNLNKKDEALSLYETHVRLYGYTKYIAQRMVLAYEQVGNRDAAIVVYKKLYTKFNDQNALKRVIELLLADYKVDDLILFLKKTNADDAVLLEAYKYKKDFDMASKIAMKIYKKSKNPKYLGQSAIYKFESIPTKNRALIHETIQKLTLALKDSSDDVFENYLGYMLIDYDIDVAKGIDYIKRALVKDPKSPFYLDSLAWGLYKQKKCKEAFENIKPALEGAKDDPTVIEHYNAIKKCMEK